MADFYQHPQITTLHRLGGRSVESLEADLMAFRDARPMGLVLPSLYSELERPALAHIVDELSHVPYLEQVIVGLDRADEQQYRHALRFFSRLPQRPEVMWNDGPRLQRILRLLEAHGLAPEEPGKGRNVWTMFGYLLATGRVQAVALHDCDIVTYERGMLARLLYPVAHPGLGFAFAKGFYPRVTADRINGRVCRLLVTPLVRALRKVCGPDDYLEFLDAFRYPLAGEFALRRDLIEEARIPSDWGLEMSILSELYRNQATSSICQVDLADAYDHKHQDLSAGDAAAGLNRMSSDIALSLFRKMATNGQVFSKSRIRTIKATYYRNALDIIDRYHDDAVFNGLRYDRHREIQAVELFAENVLDAGMAFLGNATATPFMPTWRRVQSAIPDIFEQLVDAVESDLDEFGGAIGPVVPSMRHSQHVRQRVAQHLSAVYGEDGLDALTDAVLEVADLRGHAPIRTRQAARWDAQSVFVITYGHSVVRPGEAPLRTLFRFLRSELDGIVTGVHLLPFFPYSSDDGFSIVDYDAVDPTLGTWADVERIAGAYTLMADVVLNHCSRESTWFSNFVAGEQPGADWFVTVPEGADLSQVVRPRSTPVAVPVETAHGLQRVWCTFSEDQVDLDFSNPAVLLEFLRILRDFVGHGVRYFRLDAVAYLWKALGTSCIHLPQTHEIIKLLRLLLDEMNPRTVVITETNVPIQENLSYFGNGNEAHLVYNFSLPPLMVHAMVRGTSAALTRWSMSMPPARRGRAYFNFLASHDGIGVRPAEGLLDDAEIAAMLQTLSGFGATISTRSMEDGSERPYEINVGLFDAMRGTIHAGEDGHQVDRFLLAHTIMLALEGIPAIYIHSLLATPNDHDLVAQTGRARSINRSSWDEGALHEALSDPARPHRRVLDALLARIAIRKRQAAFHPNATQYTLHYGDAIFALWRESLDRDQSVFALHNVTDQTQRIPLVELNLIRTDAWHDLLTGEPIDHDRATITLPPYGAVWISNR